MIDHHYPCPCRCPYFAVHLHQNHGLNLILIPNLHRVAHSLGRFHLNRFIFPILYQLIVFIVFSLFYQLISIKYIYQAYYPLFSIYIIYPPS